MSLAKGLLGAAIGGAAGAALWTVISYFSGLELGLVAWVVGGLAGVGMAMGNSMRGGRPAGVLAAAVAGLAILGGKLGVAHFSAQRWVEQSAAALTLNDARDHMARKVAQELAARGEPAEDDQGQFAPTVIEERDRRWGEMGPAQQRAYFESFKAESLHDSAGAAGALTILSLIFSFGLFDLIWMGLALSTAYKLGSRSVQVAAKSAQPNAPASPARRAAPAGVKQAEDVEPPSNAGFWGRIPRDMQVDPAQPGADATESREAA